MLEGLEMGGCLGQLLAPLEGFFFIIIVQY